jgi:uncharacterized DUF497 family protein
LVPALPDLEVRLRFEWNERKATTNEQKHGVTFHEAVEVFSDSRAVEHFDSFHSDSEARYCTIGWSSRQLLFVVFTQRREDDDAIRLISARTATAKERQDYEKQQSQQEKGQRS